MFIKIRKSFTQSFGDYYANRLTNRLMKKKEMLLLKKTVAVIIVILNIVKETQAACAMICLQSDCSCCVQFNGFACQTCDSEFYLSGTSCSACSTPITNCKTCTSATSCSTCKTNYYLSTPTSCQLCSSAIANCLTCSSATVCTACSGSTYCLSPSSACQLCSVAILNCNTCTSSTVCTACISTNYYLSSPSTCSLCSVGMANCKTCTSSTVCTSCTNTSYYLSAPSTCNLCSVSMANCNTCTSSTVCTACISTNYFLSTPSACVLCSTAISNCLSCTSSSVCTACINSTHYLQSPSVCSLCSVGVANCKICSSSSVCTECSSNSYYLSSPSSCSPCSAAMANCITCTSNTICAGCINSSYLIKSSGNGCEPCSAQILSCLMCTSASHCTLCDSNTFLSSDGSRCKDCSSLITNCLVCTNQTYCSQCSGSDLFFITEESKCISCTKILDYCEDCSSLSACSRCSSNISAMNSSSLCEPCSSFIDGCLNCSSSSSCSACINDSLYLTSNFKCDQCSQANLGCNTCSSESVCTLCQNGYFLNTSSLCQPCSQALSECKECSSSSVCTLCNNNTLFILNSSGLCQPCGEKVFGCISCGQNLTCNQCSNQTFFLNSAKQCQICSSPISNCLLCNSSTFCLNCINNSLIFNSNLMTCQPCLNRISNCTTCTSPTFCTECIKDPSIILNSAGVCTNCQQVISNCLQCKSLSVCTKCKSSHILELSSITQCVPCSVRMLGCTTCKSDLICTNCISGVIVTNGCSPVIGCIKVAPRAGASSRCTLCDSNIYQPQPVNGLCKCKVGVLAGKICTTIPGCTTALRNSSGEFCFMCNSAKLFLLRNYTCICKEDFQFSSGVCIDKCGDGKIYTLPCDDGNTINGDGCSSSCSVEPDYKCNSSSTVVSHCVYEGLIKFHLICVLKGKKLNTAQFLFQVSPYVPNFALMNITKNLAFYTEYNLSIVSVQQLEGTITVDLTFNQDIEGGIITAHLQYQQYYIRNPDSYLTFSINQCNSDYLLYVSAPDSAYKNIFVFISKTIGYITVLIWLVGSFFHRMIGVETLNTVQFAAIFLSFAEYYQPNFVYLSELRNTLDLYKTNLVSLQDSARQMQLYRLNIYPSFANNTSTVALVVYSCLFGLGILFLFEKVLLKILITDEDKHRSYEVTLKRMWQVVYYWLMFPTVIGFFTNTLVSSLISSIKGYTKTNIITQAQVFSILLMLTLTSFIFFKEWKYLLISQDSNSQKFKCSKSYPPFYLTYLAIITVYFQLSIQSYLPKMSNIFLLSFLSFYTLIILKWRPYKKNIHNIGIFINHSGLIFIQAIIIFQHRDDQMQYLYVMIIEFWIGLVLLWSIIRIIYELKIRISYPNKKKEQLRTLIAQQFNKHLPQEIKYYSQNLDNLSLPLANYFQKSLQINNIEVEKHRKLFHKKKNNRSIYNVSTYDQDNQEQNQIKIGFIIENEDFLR